MTHVSLIRKVGRLVIFAIVLMCCRPQLSVATDRPAHFGVSPAYPVQFPSAYPGLSRRYFPVEFASPLVFTVDSSGAVAELRIMRPEDSLFVRIYESALRSIVFEPGLRGASRVDQKIPVVVRVNPLANYPRFVFPVDSGRQVTDIDLYTRTLRCNGAVMPQLGRFPSYFFEAPVGDASLVPPYLLVKLAVDDSGRATEITPIRGNAGRFTDQLLIAMNWGDYVPAAHAEEDELFLSLLLFDDVTYPTFEIHPDSVRSVLSERLRLRLLPDTLGLMVKPVPLHMPPECVFPAPREGRMGRVTVGVRVAIDTDGEASMVGAIGADDATLRMLDALVHRLRFSPALDWSGQAVDFEGLLVVERETSTTIRTRFSWLVIELFPDVL